jgi:hypothetical protein
VFLGELELDALRTTATCHRLCARERDALGQRFRSTTVELAIAHAHAGQRKTAAKVLRAYPESGWGVPTVSRTLVLAGLLCG